MQAHFTEQVWLGGFYELAMEYEPWSEASLNEALRHFGSSQIWKAAIFDPISSLPSSSEFPHRQPGSKRADISAA